MTQVKIDKHGFIKGEEDENCWNDWQTTRHRICAFFLIKRHHLLLQLHTVILVPLLQFFKLRLDFLHLGLRGILLGIKRIHQKLDKQRQRQNTEAKTSEPFAEPREGAANRFHEDFQFPPANRAGEVIKACLFIRFEHFIVFGSGHHITNRLNRFSRRDGQR